MTTRVQRAVRLTEVPPNKWALMVQRTVFGTIFVALGIAGATAWEFPWYAIIGLIIFGATIWSSQLIVGTLKILLGPVKAYRRAVRGGSGDA